MLRKLMIKNFIAFIVLFSLCISTSNLFAQNTVKDHITRLIRSGKIKEARNEVEKYLEKDPNNIDALMMKGNVILNENISGGHIEVSANENESIFDSSLGYIRDSNQNMIIPKDVAKQIASYWKKCLELNSKRKDIHLGLCFLYSSALMKNELIDHFKQMKKSFPNEKLMYVMGDYARKMYQKKDFNASVIVYSAIIKLYPEEAGIYSDLSAIYFMEGQMKEALKFIKLAMTKKNHDNMVLQNYFMINLIIGDYDEALKGIRRIKNYPLYYFYHGLNQYYRNDSGWKAMLEKFIKSAKESNEKKIAAFLVSEDNKDDFMSYKKSLIGGKYLNYFILTQRGREKFPQKFDPHFRHALMLTYYKYYDTAIKIFQNIERKKIEMIGAETSDFLFYYAWALQDSGNLSAANAIWVKLIEDDNFYKKSAACYFYGKYLLNKGEKEKAHKIFSKVSGQAQKSKYATYCWNYVKRYKK